MAIRSKSQVQFNDSAPSAVFFTICPRWRRRFAQSHCFQGVNGAPANIISFLGGFRRMMCTFLSL